jgi:hypothetical protein
MFSEAEVRLRVDVEPGFARDRKTRPEHTTAGSTYNLPRWISCYRRGTWAS